MFGELGIENYRSIRSRGWHTSHRRSGRWRMIERGQHDEGVGGGTEEETVKEDGGGTWVG
eukprot:3885594-Pyramimonas_sp.AAC.1